MVTGPMFANIRWGTYVFFAALNFVLIFPVVYFYFPETKGRSLEEVCHCPSPLRPRLNVQLDVMFAYAYHNKKNATKLSVSNDMPKPGSRDAEAALGNLEMENQGVRSDKPTVVQQA